MSTTLTMTQPALLVAADGRNRPVKQPLVERMLAMSASRLERERTHDALCAYFDVRNTVMSQLSRPLLAEWTSDRLHHLTNQTLARWMVGRRIAEINDGAVTVVLRERRYELYGCDVAEMVTIHSLGYSFTLSCNEERGEVLIRNLEHRYV